MLSFPLSQWSLLFNSHVGAVVDILYRSNYVFMALCVILAHMNFLFACLLVFAEFYTNMHVLIHLDFFC